MTLARNYIQCLGQRGQKPYPVHQQIQHIFVRALKGSSRSGRVKERKLFCAKFKDVVFPVSMMYFTLQYVSPRTMNSQFRPVSYLAPRLRGVKLKKWINLKTFFFSFYTPQPRIQVWMFRLFVIVNHCNVICLPTNHLGVLMNSFKRRSVSRYNWNLEVLVFRRGNPGGSGEKPLGARERTKNKLISHIVSSLGFE